MNLQSRNRRRIRNNRRQGRRLPAQLFIIAIVATMLFSVVPFSNHASAREADEDQVEVTNVTPVSASDAGAAEEGEDGGGALPPIPDAITDAPAGAFEPVVTVTVVPDGTDPVVDEADDVIDPAAIDTSDETGIAPPPAGTSSITINKHVCDGPVSGDIYEMAASCDGADQVYTFNLYFGVGGPIATSQTSGSLAGFSGLVTGTYYVEEVPSASYDSALVYCKVDDYLGNPVLDYIHHEDWNWQIEIHLETDGNMAYCDWFNYNNTPKQTTGSVIINKIVCPAGFDAYDADIYGIAANCHETPAPTTFNLTDVNTDTASGDTSGSAPYTVEFADVPSGSLTIEEELPAGFGSPRVFCKNEQYTGAADAEAEVLVSGSSITTELKAGYDFLWCDWVNIPQGDVEIIIHKHLCPVGFMSTDPTELLANCNDPFDPFTFSITGAVTGPAGEQQTGDVVADSVHFSGLPADTWTVTEELPAGYGAPVVNCFIADANDEKTSIGLVPLTGDSAITLELAAGELLYCDWFNFPGDEDGSITIFKHTCEAGYDVEAYGANPWLDCPDLTNGILFTLSHGADVPLQTMTGDSIPGAVYWGGLEPGDYEVQETMPADTAYTFVFGCMSDTDDMLAPTDLIGMDSDAVLAVNLAPGEDITCHWYNVPKLHGGTVIITKYWCDGDVYSIYACDLYELGASFKLVDGWGSGVQVTTGADGDVVVNLDAGAYDLSEVGGSWCLAEASNVDGSGNIVVTENDTTYVTVFNCGPREVPKGKPTPGKFPNTGIGPVASFETAA